MGYLNTPRRYYHRKSMNAYAIGDWPIGAEFRAKQLEQPGTALPPDFPYLPQLQEAGYFAIEDLDGADVVELTRIAHLVGHEVTRVLAAVAALIEPPA